MEATLARWRVAAGEHVQRGQVIAEVETDKATNELPSPAEGVIARLVCAEGETVEVGAVIAELVPSAPAPQASAPAAPRAPSPPARPPPGPAPAQRPSDRLPAQRLAPRPVDERGGPLRSSPAVRRLARLHQLDLHALRGSGKGGRVTRDDVLRAVEGRAADTGAPFASVEPARAADTGAPFASIEPVRAADTGAPFASVEPARAPALPGTFSERAPFPTQLPGPSPQPRAAPTVEERAPAARGAYRPPQPRPMPGDRAIPFSRRREQIAEHMVYSQRTSAHVFTLAEIDMARVLRAQQADAPLAAAAGVKLTFLAYVVAAIARGLTEHPELNAVVGDRTLILRGERNIGVAVDTPDGLVVPVVHRADELGLVGLARRLQVMSERARAGTLTPDDVGGGTFTLSNPGKEGNLFGASIIRQPEVAILRIGTLVKRPVVREQDGEDVIVVRPMMYACLSYDHRVIDGRLANQFLARLTALLTHARPALAGA